MSCNVLSKPINCDTGIRFTYIETAVWIDGVTMDDSRCDGVIYIKESSVYYVLEDFLAGNSLNPKIFGAIGNGIADDSDAIESVMDFAWKMRDAGIYTNVFFPRGKYKVTRMIQVPCRTSISGDGINASVVFTNELSIDIFHFREQKNIVNDNSVPGDVINNLYTKVSNISFYGINNNGIVNTLNTENSGLVFTQMVKVEIDSVCIRGFLQQGIYFYKVYYIKLKNVNLEWNKKGLVVSECTSLQSINCESRLNGIGIYLYQTNAFSIINPLVESNVIGLFSNAVNYSDNPAYCSSIGILFYGCTGGSVFGGYFEDQIVDVYYYGSTNINVGNSFFCNISFYQTPDKGYMPPYSVYMIDSNENEIYGNSYSIEDNLPGILPQQKLQMYIAPSSYNNVIKINREEDFDNWLNANAWIYHQFEINNIMEKSPRLLCESADVEYLYGKRKAISGIFYGDSNEKPQNPQIGFLYFNVDNAKIEFFDGVNWFIT